jgi:long-subunit acyl-CoA synthetase (AMP-forming)
MLKSNAERFSSRAAFSSKNEEGVFEETVWKDLYDDVINIIYNLKERGFQKGDRFVIFSGNCLEMLKLELAVMSCGGIAIPIFAHFKKPTSDLLIQFAESTWLAVEGSAQLSQISEESFPKNVVVLRKKSESPEFNGFLDFSELRKACPSGFSPDFGSVTENEICLSMYTSGTTDIPKLVQLTHRNILSQQAAIKDILRVDEFDRYLSYLPWHHSFGGIFELFASLTNGAMYSVESSYGKDINEIFENWKLIKPTVFFSVPRIYQALYEKTRQSPEAEEIFFNSGLKFIFTAAAPLPIWLSEEFEKRNIAVIEGWGLTETAPCCTLTDPNVKRISGVVGKPIPGVEIRLDSEGEILVKGPNVMVGYYKNNEANLQIFTEDGWFKTGDVGKIVDGQLQLVSRKDRIFKLSNGEKVIPTELETAILKQCHYVQHVIVTGSGGEHPVALIFPNRGLVKKPDYVKSVDEGCFCPRSLDELGRCLSGCLMTANGEIKQKFAKLKSAAIIWDELSIDDSTLTPSMKMIPKNVLAKYKDHLNKLYGENVVTEEEVYIIEL